MLVNTRKGALKVFLGLRELLGDDCFFLSTWMTPTHRAEVIGRLRERELQGARRFLISTQVVEAGLDLDFNWVIRDFAPFDSIIQAAGRCNRHGFRNMGEVLVIPLKDEEACGKLLSSMVYDAVSLDTMRSVSSRFPCLDEEEMKEALEQYYEEIVEKKRNEDLWENLGKGKFDSLPELYHEDRKAPSLKRLIIEDAAGTVTRLINTFLDLNKTPSRMGTLMERQRLVREIFRRSIEIPEKEIREWRSALASRTYDGEADEPIRFDMALDSYVLSCQGTADLYDPVCGFIPRNLSVQGEDDGSFV